MTGNKHDERESRFSISRTRQGKWNKETKEQLDFFREEIVEPSLDHRLYAIGDDLHDIFVAKKLMALHGREVDFGEECNKAFKELEKQRDKLGLNPVKEK